MDLEEFLLTLADSEECKKITYRVQTISEPMRFYIDWDLKSNKIDDFLISFRDYIASEILRAGINVDDLFKYMVQTDASNCTLFSVVRVFKHKRDIGDLQYLDLVSKNQVITPYVDELDIYDFAVMVEAYIFDILVSKKVSIKEIVKNELFAYETNKYKLTNVNGVVFRRDGLIFDGKGYYYNLFTKKDLIKAADNIPGFAKIIEQECKNCDILYRIDEQLAVPEDQYNDYTGIKYAEFYGPKFCFSDNIFKIGKTISVRIDEESMDKLLLVVKNPDNPSDKFLHIEIETLPNPSQKEGYITTFLHGMYYPERKEFTHIDFTKNEYSYELYKQKYEESQDGVSIDAYTESDEQHYKIWCIENGHFSKETWYKLMMVSLEEEYQKLLNELIVLE